MEKKTWCMRCDCFDNEKVSRTYVRIGSSVDRRRVVAVKRQCSDEELIPNWWVRLVFGWFCGVKRASVSTGYDRRMAIMNENCRNSIPDNLWFDWTMAQSAYHFAEPEHPFSDSFPQTNRCFVHHLIHPLRIECMEYFFHVKQITPRKYLSFNIYHVPSQYLHWREQICAFYGFDSIFA